MTAQTFHKEAADRLAGRCSCPDDSGSCEWCYVYYNGPECANCGASDPWVTPMGRCNECGEPFWPQDEDGGMVRENPCECGVRPVAQGGFYVCVNPACDGYGQICSEV